MDTRATRPRWETQPRWPRLSRRELSSRPGALCSGQLLSLPDRLPELRAVSWWEGLGSFPEQAPACPLAETGNMPVPERHCPPATRKSQGKRPPHWPVPGRSWHLWLGCSAQLARPSSSSSSLTFLSQLRLPGSHACRPAGLFTDPGRTARAEQMVLSAGMHRGVSSAYGPRNSRAALLGGLRL